MNSKIYKIIVSLIILSCTYTLECRANSAPVSQQYLKFAIPVKYDPLIPTKSVNAHTKLTLPLIFEPLIAINANQNLQPVLAEAWVIPPDNTTIIINLKKNHYFSDHTEVTANDVVATIKRACSPKSEVSEELKGLAGCDEFHHGHKVEPAVSAIEKYKVKFNIKCSPATFLYQLTSPAAVTTKMLASGKLIGSGPYMIAQRANTSLTLEKNPSAANDNMAINHGLIISYVNMNETPFKLISEKFDGALMYKLDNINNFHNEKFKLFKITPNITQTLVLNNQRYPFNHLIVRKALLATFYNSLNYSCLPGSHKAYGFIPYGTGGSISNNPPQHLPDISPEKVFSVVPKLKENKVFITFHQLDDLKNQCLEDQIISFAHKYHIEVNFHHHKNYPELESLYLHHKIDGFLELYVFRNREAYSTLQYFSRNGENNANLKDAEIDKVLQNIMMTNTTHGRYQMYRNVNRYIQDKAIIIPLLYMDHGNLLSICINGTNDNFLFNPFIHLKQLTKSDSCYLQKVSIT